MDRSLSANVSLRDVYKVFFRHRRKAIWFAGSVMSAVILLTLLTPKRYRSEGKLFVRLGRENVGLDPTATLGQAPVVAVPQSREDEINSVVEILKSRNLLEKVVDDLGPGMILSGKLRESPPDAADAGGKASDWRQFVPFVSQLSPREQAIVNLRRHIGVESIKKTNVVMISHEGPDPALSQKIVARFIEFYLDEHGRLNRTAGAHEFLAEQTTRLRASLASAERRLRDLKNETGIAAAAEQQRIVVARIGQLKDELMRTEAALQASIAEARGLRESLGGLAKLNVIGRTTGLPNQPADEVRQQVYQLQLREQELLSKYTEEHFEVQQVQRQLAAARAVLGSRQKPVGTQTASAGQALDENSRDATLIASEPALASLHAKATKLRTQLAQLEEELKTLNDDSLHVAELEREIQILEASYRQYAQSLEQTRIDESLESQRINNISVAQPATFNAEPVGPYEKLNLLLGLVLAVGGGIGLALVCEYADHSLKSPEEIEKYLGLPTLVSIPRIDRVRVAMIERN